MSEIVERLRRAEGLGLNDGRLMLEAADEIERLRAENERLLHEKSQWQPIYQVLDKDRARLREEIERLREANDAEAIAYADMMVALVQIRNGSPPAHDEVVRLIERAQRARTQADAAPELLGRMSNDAKIAR